MDPVSIALIVISAINLIASVGGSVWSNAREQKNYEQAIDYNKPVNQVARLAEAGLNPTMAAGSSNTVSVNQPAVTNPAESLIGGMTGIANMYANSQGITLRREQFGLQKSKLELDVIKTDIQKRLAEQALSKGDLDLALKALTYDTQVQTQPAVIQRALADAGYAGNRKSMSDIDLAAYQDYTDNRLAEQRMRINKGNAEIDYLTNVKPQLEWYRAYSSRMSVEEANRHNVVMEQETEKARKMSQQDRDRRYELAVKQYNLAVQQQDWEKAHYWTDVALGVLGAGVRTAASRYGIPIR